VEKTVKKILIFFTVFPPTNQKPSCNKNFFTVFPTDQSEAEWRCFP
jgi:hypothetical protein